VRDSILARINSRHAIVSRSVIGREVRSQQTDIDWIQLRVVTATDIRVRVREFAHEFSQYVSQAQPIPTYGTKGAYLSRSFCQLTPFIEG
jgi:hypothetical protein